MKNRILFIAPKFFDYYRLIINNLQEKGFIVDYYPDIPSAFFRYFHREKALDLYYSSILKKIIDISYDYIFVIKGDAIPINFLSSIKRKNTKSVFINYLWDDIKRSPGTLERHKYYDRVISYSRLDAIEYNLDFYPIFYHIGNEVYNSNKKYDLSFIGTWHSNRLEFISLLKRSYPKLKFFIHLYCPYGRLKNIRGILGIVQGKLKLNKLSYRKLIKICSESRVSLDFAIKGQTAPTTRIIEVMAVRTKVITTCADIVNYEYYHADNILIIDPENIVISEEWLSKDFYDLSDSVIMKYDIGNWVNNIFLKS